MALSFVPVPVLAHGAIVDVASVAAISIQARYDTGEAMAGAQVSVFAPDTPTQPWQLGRTDAAGAFVFVPDERSGRWAVQVRQAGHGAMAYVEMGADSANVVVTVTSNAGLTLAQKLLMIACVLWGAVGTALYFRTARIKAPA